MTGVIGGEITNFQTWFDNTSQSCNEQAASLREALGEKFGFEKTWDPNYADWQVNTVMAPLNLHTWLEVTNKKTGSVITLDPWANQVKFEPRPLPLWDKK